MTSWTFKTAKGRVWHSGAITYSVGVYALGWWLLLNASAMTFVPSVILLGHAMIIAAYLIHECAHNTLFTINRHNMQLASLLGWICGSCYGTVEDIRNKHFRHHVENDDVVWFDYEGFFQQRPLVYRVTIFLERVLHPRSLYFNARHYGVHRFYYSRAAQSITEEHRSHSYSWWALVDARTPQSTGVHGVLGCLHADDHRTAICRWPRA